MATLAALVKQVLKERGLKTISFKDRELWEEAYRRSSGTMIHPTNQWHNIYTSIRRSDLFKENGEVVAPGFLGIERPHKIFEIVEGEE